MCQTYNEKKGKSKQLKKYNCPIRKTLQHLKNETRNTKCIIGDTTIKTEMGEKLGEK